jgi:hypothetical protein
MLRLLARDGVEARIPHRNLGRYDSAAGYDPDFFWRHARGETLRRGLPGVPAGFTGKKRREMVDELLKRGIDGNDESIRGSG